MIQVPEVFEIGLAVQSCNNVFNLILLMHINEPDGELAIKFRNDKKCPPASRLFWTQNITKNMVPDV